MFDKFNKKEKPFLGYGGFGGASSGLLVTAGEVQPFEVRYLVIGGGGAGNANGPGGGGGGGFLTGTFPSIDIDTSYPATIGTGAPGAYGPIFANPRRGNNSVFHTVTSNGGGGGNGGVDTKVNTDPNNIPFQNGGSGGGGFYSPFNNGNHGGTSMNPPLGQGTAGGFGHQGVISYGGGGGGGANQSGGGSSEVGSNTTAGTGGAGKLSDITGSNVYYAGGGGGTVATFPTQNYSGGAGGTGGGGPGGGPGAPAPPTQGQNPMPGTPGTTNTGGGGGGGHGPNVSTGGSGGPGVVILRYPGSRTISSPGGLVFSTTTVGSDKVTTITSGSGNVIWS